MTCCSGRRAAAAAAATPLLAPAVPVPVRRLPAAGGLLAYTGDATLALRGPASGRIYRVAPGGRPFEADPRDVDALLRCGLFRRAVQPGSFD